MDPARVSLVRWLRQQLHQPLRDRERLEAAVEHDDPAEARRWLEEAAFSDAQRSFLEELIEAWERQAGQRR